MKETTPYLIDIKTVSRLIEYSKPFLSDAVSLQKVSDRSAEQLTEFFPFDFIFLMRVNKKMECMEYASCHLPDNCKLEPALEADLLSVLKEQVIAHGIRTLQLLNVSGTTIAVCPVIHQNELVGLSVFGSNSLTMHWSAPQLEMIRTVSSIISISFVHYDHIQQQQLHNFVFESLLNSLNANVYITDIETDQILYMNQSMKNIFHIENPEGHICWKVLQTGMSSRCPFCPLDKLLSQKNGPSTYQWEETNTVTGRNYENYDSLIHWTDGSVVHLQQSVDITDIKRLTKAADFDELTEMLNRRAGKLALSNSILQAKEANRPLLVELYDINRLKNVNDAFGHKAGDHLIRMISKIVRSHIGKEDYAFRLSGDEFIIVFEQATRQEAAQINQEILSLLNQQSYEEHLPYEVSYCYGLLEILPADSLSISEILTQVDERMYEQKRRFHINKNAQIAKFDPSANSSAIEGFTYDKERLYDALVRSTEDYIYICNMKTGTFRYPKNMVEEFGLPGEVIQNAASVWGSKVHEEDKPAFLESNQEIVDGRTDTHCVEYRAQNKQGEWIWLRCRGHLERDNDGQPSLFAGIISNLGRKNKIDHVTGLMNKYEFEADLKKALSDGQNKTLGLMKLGMDDFNHINDLYDRDFGDDVIRITAQKIQGMLPGNARIYRLDGDEFGIVVNNGDGDKVLELFSRIRQCFKHQQMYKGRKYHCTLSAGCALYPKDAGQYTDLLKYAGYSLEHAKNNGKNCISFFSNNILNNKTRALKMIELLRDSVENRYYGFMLNYQPQVYAQTGVLYGAEALARWSCEIFGMVSPVEFIPLLEDSGLIVPVGKWILYEAAKQCKKWITVNPSFVMSINLSYLQLLDPEFVPYLKDCLQKLELEPRHLILELTESCMMKNQLTVNKTFQELRQIGIQIAIDDFGTGYSSLGLLKESPADLVKIDRTFIRDVKSSSFDATFIRFIVELCHTVGIQVCLEGVETKEDYQCVSSMGLDFIQGYLFGRPEQSETFEQNFFKQI